MSIEKCPQVRGLYDSGACVNSGFWGFWEPILLNHHPECVVDLYVSDNGEYAPIILGGIVTDDDGDMQGHTCELTIVAKLIVRYYALSLVSLLL